MSLASCRECHGQVSTEARACPHCGVPEPVPPPQLVKPHARKRGGWWFAALLIGMFVSAGVIGNYVFPAKKSPLITPPPRPTAPGVPDISGAPPGDPRSVATRAIRDADHPCGTVVSAVRLSTGGIRAACSNGETYRVFAHQGRELAMKCSAAAQLGVSGC